MHLTQNNEAMNPCQPDSADLVKPSTMEQLGFSTDITADLQLSRCSGKSLHSESYVSKWISERLANPRLSVKPIPLHDMKGWVIEPDSGNIRHTSGMFFSITGVKVRHRKQGSELTWDQPIIDQPEIGILGILVKKIMGVMHFCLQAKEEPGNINFVQLSPTVQATYSNYTQVHGGTPTRFINYFLDNDNVRILFAKLQTEDGGRFLYKSNRNMIVEVDESEPIDLPDGFIWLTLRQIISLLRRSNLIHACTRSILSAIILPQTRSKKSQNALPRILNGACGSVAEAVQWLDGKKAANHILAKREGLITLDDWKMDTEGFFSHFEWRFFRIIGLEVSSTEREVCHWCQPILANPESGIIGLLITVRNGERMFLMQAKAEVGNRSTVQLGPTVQFTPGNYAGNEKLPKPFLFDEFSQLSTFPVVSESFQSEEGARFFLEQHSHRILALPDETELILPPDYRWISESQLRFFLHLGESVNSCARSIISCLI
jgi:oxidase EvaA